MKKVIWGMLLIVAAVCILLCSLNADLGVIGSLPTFFIIVTAVSVAVLISLCIDRSWKNLPFLAAFWFLLTEKDIAALLGREDSNLINNWLVVGCAVLLSIGISLILSPIKRAKKKRNNSHFHVYIGNEHSKSRFSSESRYIDCKTFKNYWYEVKMGDGSIYFVNPEQYTGNGILEVSCKMGNIEINVPAGWNIQNDVECKLGSVSMPDCIAADGPMLTVCGFCKLGNINIRYCN